MALYYRDCVRGLTALGIAILAALFSSCQTVETHHAYSAAYYFREGMWCGNFPVDPVGGRIAVLATLAELKMTARQEGLLPHGAFIDSRTPDDYDVRIFILPGGRHTPGARIGVRVTGFGTHREVCDRILDAIGRHLQANPPVAVVPVTPAPVATPGSPVPMAVPPPQAAGQGSLPPQPIPLR